MCSYGEIFAGIMFGHPEPGSWVVQPTSILCLALVRSIGAKLSTLLQVVSVLEGCRRGLKFVMW